MRCYENHWQIGIAHRQLTLKLEPIHPWHADVEYQAIWQARPTRAQELFGRSEHLDVESDGSDQPRKRLTDRAIVIDNENQRGRHRP